MVCSVVSGDDIKGFICSAVENFHELKHPNGRTLWFEFHGWSGVTFWEDINEWIEVDDWWDDEWLCDYQESWLNQRKEK